MIQARRPSSHFKDSQELPIDLVKLVRESIEEAFGEDLPPGVEVSGRIFKEEILVRVGWPVTENGLRFMNVEASVDFHTSQNANERIHVCLDALQASMEEFIDAEGDIEVPRYWTEFTFEKEKVFIQFSPVNAKLEDAADAFLKEHGYLEDGSRELDGVTTDSSTAGGDSSAVTPTTAAGLRGQWPGTALAGVFGSKRSVGLDGLAGSDGSGEPVGSGEPPLSLDDENPFESEALRQAKLELQRNPSGKIH